MREGGQARRLSKQRALLTSLIAKGIKGDTKAATLRETRRVLKPGGSLHLLDFGGHSHGWLARLFHSSHELEDNAEHRVVALMREAGLANPESVAHRAMILGGITSYRAAA